MRIAASSAPTPERELILRRHFMPAKDISAANLSFVERLLNGSSRQPRSPEWEEYSSAWNREPVGQRPSLGPSFRPRSLFNPAPGSNPRKTHPSRNQVQDARHAGIQERLNELIRNYRVRGHMIAAIDPLNAPRWTPPELDPEYDAFSESELNLLTGSSTLPYDEPLTIREIIQRLRDTYCRSIGVQYMHIDDGAVRHWLQHRMESTQNHCSLGREQQSRILTRLTDAVLFEEFLRKNFTGAKTFSLEGSETLLPLLDLVMEQAGTQGTRDVIVAMAHRGRLNVLAHIIGKQPSEIFREFADRDPSRWEGRGDVKYHLGHSGTWVTSDGHELHISLCFNPSHLEFVNPVAMGRVRARQARRGDSECRQVLGIIIHGDASMAGEGVVQESLNLSGLAGYSIGGCLHVVINNQIGFTTLPTQTRSTIYATDVARMLQVPLFHVNGENPEAVAQVVRLAMEFRHEFQRDVFIDMYGYRRHGHNEIDEPSFTQPLLYRAIARRPDVRKSYLAQLLQLKGLTITTDEASEIERSRRENLEQQLAAAQNESVAEPATMAGIWSHYIGGAEPAEEPETSIDESRIATLLDSLCRVPDDFELHPKLKRLIDSRREMAQGARPLDWSAAEALAFASLVTEGVHIRLTGQDTERGTFSQRHAVLHDFEDGSRYVPLQHVAAGQAPFEILNSPLSEAAALGFEYGYSLDSPDKLVIWEAQFGDFANAAQVIIDQFIASAEDKWRRLSGLVLLLPHGFEGMGPEHSSARIERFLQLAAEDNIQIAQPTTPAQYFHLLRRQALRTWRKPLIVFTPKSLLRHPNAVSTLQQFAQNHFQRVIPAQTAGEGGDRVSRVLLCSGRVFYDLKEYQEEHHSPAAIVRFEQLYPPRTELLESSLDSFKDGTPVIWVQEEPENMGAWRFLRGRFGESLFGRFPLQLVSRPESASPASGSAGAHKLEQQRLMHRAFGDGDPPDTCKPR